MSRIDEIRERQKQRLRQSQPEVVRPSLSGMYSDINYLLSCIEGRGVADVAFTAYNQAIEDAKNAIRGEKVDDPYAATFINAIARKCSPNVYVNRLATTPTAGESMPDLPFACADCGVQQHADGICANCGGKNLRRTAGGERCTECGSGLYDNPFHFDPSAGTSGLYRWCVSPAPPAKATPLCPVHQHLEDSNNLECEIGGNNCVACSLNERAELLKLIAPFAAKDGSEDSLTVMQRVADFYDTHQGENRVVISYPAATPVPAEAAAQDESLKQKGGL